MAINSIIAAPPLPRAATLTGSAATIALGSVCCAMDEFEVPVAGGENILDLWLLPPPPCSNPPTGQEPKRGLRQALLRPRLG